MPSIRRNLSRVAKTALLAFFFVPVATAISGTWASAHNSIDTSTPADGAVVTAPLDTWVLSFANDVPLDSASAEVIGADGVRTELPTPTHGDSQKVIRFTLPTGLTGEVSGRWRLVSSDGHVVSGRVQFTIEEGPVATTIVPDGSTGVPIDPASDATDGADRLNVAPEPVRWGLRLANYAAVLLFGGLLFIEMRVAPGTTGMPRSLRLAEASAIVMTVVPALQALIFLSDVHGTSIFGALGHLGDLFTTTPASMMLLRAVSGAVFLHLLSTRSLHNFKGPFPALAGANATVHLVALAYVGHSRSQGAPWLAIPVDVLHTAASAVWLGGLAVFILLVVPNIDPGRSLVAFARYGEAAKYAVIAIVATGVVQSLRLHGGITTLFTSPHGRWLLLKIIVVGLMMKVGDVNRRRLMRAVPTRDGAIEARRRMLVRASTTEAALGAVVIAITAALVTSSFG